jgi:hypothetical protein
MKRLMMCFVVLCFAVSCFCGCGKLAEKTNDSAPTPTPTPTLAPAKK